MIAITADGRTITNPVELRAHLETLKPKRRGRIKRLVAAKREWQSALREVAETSTTEFKRKRVNEE